MKKRLYILAVVTSMLSLRSADAQQTTLLGHQELIGYFNPSLIGGSNGQVSYLYRYQWEGFGPSSNTLFFKYPLKSSGKFYSPHAIGSFFQYEDFDLVDRTKLEFFMANTLFESDKLRIGFGINAGLSYSGINTDDFNLEELVDPELANVDRRLSVTNKVGFSVYHKFVDVGLAARTFNVQSISDYHSSLSFKVPLKNPKFRLNPIVIFRMTEDFQHQLEGQLKTTYDQKISLTAGYRENFGAIFQLGIRINNSAKVSYGVETPQNNGSSLGLTHELFGSYYFESPALVQHRKDSVIKARRDSLNRARIEKYRTQKAEEAANDDSLSILGTPEKEQPEEQDSDSLNIESEAMKKEDSENNEGEIYTSLDDVVGNISDNTHVILDHIGFEPGLYLLTPDSYQELDKLFNYIRHHKSLHIEIQGHTDNSGSPDTNLSLSRYRALAVYNYLVSRGIDPAKMNVIGYGENQPLYPNDTKENRELNRRIEIVFIRK
ncbi:type IX secretion system membrane protein PorP/SprF [Ekhidna sp.]